MKKIIVTIFILFSLTILFACESASTEKHVVSFINEGAIWKVLEVNNDRKVAVTDWPSEPSKVGHRFDGWHEGNRLFDLNNERITDDISLNSKFTSLDGDDVNSEYITVTFYDRNQVSMPSISKKIEKDTIIAKPSFADTNISGYSFDDWYTTAGYNELFDFTAVLKGNTDIYGKWDVLNGTKEYVTVTFYDRNQEPMSSLSKQIEKGMKITEPTSLDTYESGYAFDDWYTSNTYNKAYDFNLNINTDTDIYGKWEVSDGLNFTGYYESIPSSITGNTLKKALHDLIDGHKTYSYSSLSEHMKTTDKDPDTGTTYLTYGGSGSYNKEHVWPKSRGQFENKLPMYSDMHHLRPTNSSLNNERNNFYFDEGGIATTNSPQYGNKIVKNVSFEPRDLDKGDVARMCFYMAVRYEGDVSGELDLELVEDPPLGAGQDQVGGKLPLMGKLSTLLKWHKDDPVSKLEISRNNEIYKLQGNRNPFIDYPDAVLHVFNELKTTKNLVSPERLLEIAASYQEISEKAIIQYFKENYLV